MSTATPRILLTDAAVKREPFAQNKPRIVRDSQSRRASRVDRQTQEDFPLSVRGTTRERSTRCAP